MDPRWRHPFTCIIAGPTQCGKTEWVIRFITNVDQMMTPTPQEIVWHYGSWQPAYERLRHCVTFKEGLPEMDESDHKRRLVVIDDLMTETDGRVTKLFTKGSHHHNMSVIYIVQNLFSANKEHRTLSLNAHYLVLFKNPRDVSQMCTLAKQMYPGRGRYLQDAYKQATSQCHGYLLTDLTQTCPDAWRLGCVWEKVREWTRPEKVLYVRIRQRGAVPCVSQERASVSLD